LPDKITWLYKRKQHCW